MKTPTFGSPLIIIGAGEWSAKIRFHSPNRSFIGEKRKLTGNFASFHCVVAQSQTESLASNGNLERSDVVGRHVIFAAAFVFVVDDVFANVVIRSSVTNRRLSSATVDDVDEHHNCFAKRYKQLKWRENKRRKVETDEREHSWTRVESRQDLGWPRPGLRPVKALPFGLKKRVV